MDNKATRDAYGKKLVELGEKNSRIVVLDADLSSSTRTKYFAEKFPDRFYNCGIAEANMAAIAAGLSAVGKIPFISTFAVFATGRAWEIIRQSIAYSNLPVKIVATHAGLSVGKDGASHQMFEDIALMRVLPNIKILCPADAIETGKMLDHILEIEGPVYLRLGRPKVPTIYPGDLPFKLGKNRVLRSGSDITLCACGIMVSKTLKAAEMLKKEGISAEVINVSTLKPLDHRTILNSLQKTHRLISAEEHSVIGGLGETLASLITKNNLKVNQKMIGLQDTFGESGSPDKLFPKYGLTSKDILKQAQKIMKDK